MEIYEVALKNGAKAPDVAVPAVMMVLEDMLDDQPFRFYDLVMLARDKNYEVFGGIDDLVSRGLLERDGRMHDIASDVMHPSVSGEGITMTLGSPYAE